ncbi:MAG: endonuclease/exonuclease/phosphatase family protein [Tepidisphaeraceae bacterium]
MQTVRPGEALRIVAFNIRYNNPADGINAWDARRGRCLQAIRKLNPDLLALQEVLAGPQVELAEALADYGAVAVHRDDGKFAGEATPIFYRKSRFERVDHGVFWLSTTPSVIGSVGWDASICTWARLKDLATRRELLLANAHFDHMGTAARTNIAKLIMAKMKEIAEALPVIMAGDLNSFDDSPAYAEFVRDSHACGPGWTDTFRAMHAPSPDEETCHDFKGRIAGRRIDYVFVSPEFATLSAGIDRDRDSERLFASDHYPVWCDLAWR